MSFIEFLLEYYIYILAVLVILIVGVIGFLVDSKNKEKKQKAKANVEATPAVNGDVNNASVNAVNATGAVNSVDVNNQPQMVNSMPTGDVGAANANVNLSGVMPDMVNNALDNNGVDMVQAMQPVMPSEVANHSSTESVNVVNNDLNNMQSLQPTMPNMVDNQQPAMNTNLESGMADVLGNVNVMNNSQPLQSVMPDMNVNPIPVTPIQVENQMTTNANQGNMMGVQNLQPDMSNMAVNSVPVQNMQQSQSQVNVGLNEVPVQTVNNGVGMVSTLNNESNMNVLQGMHPVMPANTGNPMSLNPVNPGVPVTDNVNANLNSQSQVMGTANVGMPNNVGMNQPVMPNPNGGQVVQNANVVGQPVNNSNMPGNSNVVTSDGSQPFDISSMFANNQ